MLAYVRCRLGTYTYENGNVYKGNWHEDQPHGEGSFTWKEGHTYVGEYRHGLKHGIGVYTDVSGESGCAARDQPCCATGP